MTRLALVGYGRIAPKHLEAFRAQGAEFVACCNRSPEGRQKAESEGGIPHTYASIGEMLDRERPQGVICCASMQHIYAAALEIIGRGIPTLLEKPPGTSLAEYQQLCQLAQQNNTPVMVGLNRRHYSVLRRAVEDAGGFKAISAVSLEWSEDPQHFLSRGFSIEHVSRMVFGNTLHGLDLLTFLAGRVDAPNVVGLSLGDPLRWMMALDGVSERGALVTFNSTWDSPGRWRLSFCSPGRRYIFAPLETCQVMETGLKETRIIEPDAPDIQFKPGFFEQAKAFLHMIASGIALAPHSLADVEPAMQLAERLTVACQAGSSAANGRVRIHHNPSQPPVPKPLRVVAFADSLAMMRDEPPILWDDTWPSHLANELRAAGLSAEVINCGARSRTAEQLLGDEFTLHVINKRPDVVVVQVGIVDCMPRIFSLREHALLNHPLVPQRVRGWVVRRRSARRNELLSNSDPLSKVYTPPDRFAECLEQFRLALTRLNNPPRVVVLPIVCDSRAMDRKSPGHRDNLLKYNQLLRSFAQKSGAGWIEPSELAPEAEASELFVGDGYHFSAAGGLRCAQLVCELIANKAIAK